MSPSFMTGGMVAVHDPADVVMAVAVTLPATTCGAATLSYRA
jgi:hypothetical protein